MAGGLARGGEQGDLRRRCAQLAQRRKQSRDAGGLARARAARDQRQVVLQRQRDGSLLLGAQAHRGQFRQDSLDGLIARLRDVVGQAAVAPRPRQGGQACRSRALLRPHPPQRQSIAAQNKRFARLAHQLAQRPRALRLGGIQTDASVALVHRRENSREKGLGQGVLLPADLAQKTIEGNLAKSPPRFGRRFLRAVDADAVARAESPNFDAVHCPHLLPLRQLVSFALHSTAAILSGPD